MALGQADYPSIDGVPEVGRILERAASVEKRLVTNPI
jgi:hypothetical protein